MRYNGLVFLAVRIKPLQTQINNTRNFILDARMSTAAVDAADLQQACGNMPHFSYR